MRVQLHLPVHIVPQHTVALCGVDSQEALCDMDSQEALCDVDSQEPSVSNILGRLRKPSCCHFVVVDRFLYL